MRISVWAPLAQTVWVYVVGGGEHVLLPEGGRPGWYAADVPELAHGVDYRLVLDDSDPVPDPRARHLPLGVNGPARAWDATTFAWTDADWSGRALDRGAVIYELHVGTFTRTGTLDSAVEKLAHLVELGVTHVELMPLAAFDGPRGWGYDGVTLESVHVPYGGPDALCRFVDAAHAAGVAVLLDVVHNHLGPSGNHWPKFGPFMTDAHRTPWGDAVNLDHPGSDDVRAILLSTVTGLIRDFHLDGMRMDAVHEFRDDRARTYLEELSDTVAELGQELGRPLCLIAESDRNDPRTVRATADGGLGMTAQWADDVHHALHWLLTGENQGYYADFASATATAHTLEHGFHHDGRWSSFRGRTHGRPVDWSATDPWRLVVSLQTHDQVGNRAVGDRLSMLVEPDRLAAGAALLLTLPYTPMLFMGEEWGAGTPWRFFSSFPGEELADAVTEGRRAEFEDHGWDPESVPDPQAPETFWVSKLRWEEAAESDHQRLFRWYRALADLRRHHGDLGPGQAAVGLKTAADLRCSWGGDDNRPDWFGLARAGVRTLVNLSAHPLDVPMSALEAEASAQVGDFEVLLAWGEVSLEGSTASLGPGASGVLRRR